MPKQTKTLPKNGTTHGAESALAAVKASKAQRLAHRQRVPPSESWAAMVAKRFRDAVVSEVEVRRDGAGLTVWDWSQVNSIYTAAAGLAQAYAYLGLHGWLDKAKADFIPAVGSVMRLERHLQDSLRSLGLDKDQTFDVLAALYASPPHEVIEAETIMANPPFACADQFGKCEAEAVAASENASGEPVVRKSIRPAGPRQTRAYATW